MANFEPLSLLTGLVGLFGFLTLHFLVTKKTHLSFSSLVVSGHYFVRLKSKHLCKVTSKGGFPALTVISDLAGFVGLGIFILGTADSFKDIFPSFAKSDFVSNSAVLYSVPILLLLTYLCLFGLLKEYEVYLGWNFPFAAARSFVTKHAMPNSKPKQSSFSKFDSGRPRVNVNYLKPQKNNQPRTAVGPKVDSWTDADFRTKEDSLKAKDNSVNKPVDWLPAGSYNRRNLPEPSQKVKNILADIGLPPRNSISLGESGQSSRVKIVAPKGNRVILKSTKKTLSK